MKGFRDRIRQLNPLNALGRLQLEEVLSEGSFLELRKGDVLFREGDNDDNAFYLLEGEMELVGDRVRRIDPESRSSQCAIGNLHPRPFTCTVTSDTAHVLQLSRERVERLVARQQMVSGGAEGLAVSDLSSPQEVDDDWMFNIIQSDIFRALPTENIERFFAAVQPIELEAGAVVLTQGEQGDFYYMIVRGECIISRETPDGTMELAELGPGDGFGEEALISGNPRNATATMKTAGILMRLSKQDFTELLVRPIIRSVSATTAKRAVDRDQAVLIDVRGEGEHEFHSLEGSIHIPLDDLRLRAWELDRDVSYVAYCDTGARSSCAAFLLCERGFDAAYLEGGLSSLVSLIH